MFTELHHSCERLSWTKTWLRSFWLDTQLVSTTSSKKWSCVGHVQLCFLQVRFVCNVLAGDLWSKMSAFDDLLKEDALLTSFLNYNRIPFLSLLDGAWLHSGGHCGAGRPK